MKKYIALGIFMIFVAVNFTSSNEIDDIFDMIDDEINESVYNDYFINDTDIMEELEMAIEWGHDEGLTTFDNLEQFEHKSSLKREAAAKFYAEFGGLVVGLNEDSSKYDCSFKDNNTTHYGLRSFVIKACNMGLFKGYNGSYLPKESLTNGQGIVVLIKALEGEKAKTSQGHFAQPYFMRAQELNLIHKLEAGEYENLDQPATRGDIMLMMYRAAKQLDMVE